jgi:hypothetical protein
VTVSHQPCSYSHSAVHCRAVQRSAAQTAGSSKNTVQYCTSGLEAGERTGRSFCRIFCRMSRSPVPPACRPQVPPSTWASPVVPPHPGPSCPLPSSSLHTHWLSATCFTCQGTSLRIRAARYWAPLPPCSPPPGPPTQRSGSDPGACLAEK